MLTHTNLVVNALNAVAGMGFDADTAYIHSGAMFHLADGASTFGVTLVGGRHAFVPRFEPVEVLQIIAREKITHAQFVPTMINMLVNHPRFGEFDISTLKLILYGASPMPEGVLRKAMEVMPHVGMIHGYGMTEAAPIVTLLPARYTTLDGPYAGRLKSCGLAALTCEVKVVDARRKEVPRGTAGELAIRGAQHHEGLLEQAGRDRGGAGGRLVLLRRRRHHGQGRLRLHRRPAEGHDHLGRRERLFGRGRERDLADAGRRRGRGDRRARRALGRAGARDHRAQAGRRRLRPRRCWSSAARRSPATSARAASTSATRRCRSAAPARC